MKKQPKPVKGTAAVTEQVIADLKQRTKAGKKKYGRVLETHNGRDALWDAYEEALDLAQYLKQAIMERDDKQEQTREQMEHMRKRDNEAWWDEYYRDQGSRPPGPCCSNGCKAWDCPNL